MGIHQTAGFLKNLANCTATGSDWCWDEVGKIGKIRECPTEEETQNLIAQVGAITNSLDTTKNNLVKAFEKLLNLKPGTVARVTNKLPNNVKMGPPRNPKGPRRKQCHPRGRRGSITGPSQGRPFGPVRKPRSHSREARGRSSRNRSRSASMDGTR